ncbi:MAG: glycosyltransferase [Candidatus Rokubacteria bacterium]|nr:glycosyltransferase [Candidatus Rokubacteria bacterium]
MRVLIHALAALETGGSDRHLRGMLSSLEAADPSAQYVVYVSTAFPIRQAPGRVSVRSVPLHGQFHRLWWDQVVFPMITVSERADVVWATLSFGMLRPPVRQIAFQRNAMYYCPAYLETLGRRDLLVTRIRRALLYRAMRASRWIITPTLAMRDMIRGVHPELPSDRFEIMPHPYDPAVAREPLSGAVASALADAPPGTVRFLYVGHILSFKALPFVLDAFRRAVDRTARPLRLYLTIAPEDWPQGFDRFVRRVEALDLGQQVVILGKVRGETIERLYRACDVLVFPSLCESFGFPLLEARIYGLPIVAADTAVNREMAGEGALYYAPGDVEGAAKLFELTAADRELRRSLAARRPSGPPGPTWVEYSQRCLELSRAPAQDE